MIIPSSQLKNIVPKVMSAVVVPHGCIDVIHALNNNKMKTYAAVNFFSVGGVDIINRYISKDVLPITLLVIASLWHWRHQFDFIKQKTIKYAALSFLLATSSFTPYLVYTFLTLWHVPHQYHKNINILKARPRISSGLLLITTTIAVSMDNSLMKKWYSSPFVLGFVLAHVYYQEVVMR